MKLRIIDENTWLFPDTEPAAAQTTEALLARNGHTGVQLWTDRSSDCVRVEFSLPEGIGARVYQMLPTRVEANSGAKTHTASDYSEVCDFVTHRAPFEVYDITAPLHAEALRGTGSMEAPLKRGPVVLFVRLEAAKDMAPVRGRISLRLEAGGEAAGAELPVEVVGARVPELSREGFGIVNWLKLEEICALHQVEMDSPAFWRIVDAYLDNQLELRSNHLMLPGGQPVRDARGRVEGFDFSRCRRLGEMAEKKGFSCLYGGFVAHWIHWQDAEIMLLWDRAVDVTSREGYRQLKLYFTGLWELVAQMNWQSQWMQCLVDEPQFANSAAYRILSDICRKCMPGVTIHDPVETYEIGGATDVWCLKQAQFDQYRAIWKELQGMGERLWVYTCGFPAGKVMNRATDLPLLAGRLPFWLCAREGFEGFLHWGYNAWNGRDPVKYNCWNEENYLLPPGNGFIVYPGKDGPVNSLRAQIQLFGAEDCELLRQLPEEEIHRLCGKLCTDFSQYVTDVKTFAQVRRELLHSVR